MALVSILDLRFWKRPSVPCILQTEATECGLACLAMVAGHFGHRIDLATMRRRFSISLKGTTLKSLIVIAQGMSLRARPLKLGLEQLANLTCPCILHWDMNHFVVLTSVDARGVVIHDPAVGPRRVAMHEASKHFTGVALELAPTPQFKRSVEVVQFRLLDLMGQVIGLRRGLVQLMLIAAAMQVFSLIMPFYLQWIVDEALVVGDRSLISVLGIGFLLLVVAQTAMSSVRSWATTTLATNLNFQWFSNAFSHLMRLPLPYFEKRHLGDILSRFGSIQTIQRNLTTQFVEAVIDGVLVIVTFAVMSIYSITMSLVAVVAIALYVLLRLSIFKMLREATAEQIIHSAKQQSHLMESTRGVQSIRVFNRVEERRIGWMNALADQFNTDLRISRLNISQVTANALLFGVERVIVIWLGALAVLDGHFSVGMLLAFLSYKEQFTQRLSAFVDKIFEFRMLGLHGERVADIVLTEPETVSTAVEVDVAEIEPNIELRGVSFRYSDGEPEILQRVNLTIPAGQCLVIAGSSGCGKTTLVKLILGLLEPTEGEILIGGVRLDVLGLVNLRQLMGTVMQEDQLFAGSIADNICFFDSSPIQELIETSAERAAIHDEIIAMPMGYHTLVGDIGNGFSGGQKQRILLARALYKQPRMLCLDEATSHLDLLNEQRVNNSIRMLQITRIIVAHRTETIATAERVVVLEQGRIIRDFIQPSR